MRAALFPVLMLLAGAASTYGQPAEESCIAELRVVALRQKVEEANLESARMLKQHMEVVDRALNAIRLNTKCVSESIWCRSETKAMDLAQLELQLSQQRLASQQALVRTLMLQYQLARTSQCAP